MNFLKEYKKNALTSLTNQKKFIDTIKISV